MADDKSTTEDTTVSEDTSTNEETQDTDLEDIEVTPEELDDGEDETEEAQDTEAEKTDTEPSESEEESEEGAEDQNTGTQESDEDKQKRLNNEFAQRRIQEKQQREQKVRDEQATYVQEVEDDPVQLAVRQNQVETYNLKVERNSDKLSTGYERAIKDFDVLNSTDPVVKAEVDAAIDAFQAMYVNIDAYGNPTDVRGDLYKYLQSKADSISQLTGIKSTRQEKSKTKEKSKILTVPSKAPKEPKVDPDLEAFDEEAKR